MAAGIPGLVKASKHGAQLAAVRARGGVRKIADRAKKATPDPVANGIAVAQRGPGAVWDKGKQDVNHVVDAGKGFVAKQLGVDKNELAHAPHAAAAHGRAAVQKGIGAANDMKAWGAQQASHGVSTGMQMVGTAREHTQAGLAAARQKATQTTRWTQQQGSQIYVATIGGVVDEIDDIMGQLTNPVLTQLASNLLRCIADAVDHWKNSAEFVDIRIMGMHATGQVGCLTGDSLAPSIFMGSGLTGLSGGPALVRDAVITAVSENFELWQSGVAVPALPWYPAFTAVMAPYIGPMPNIPTPLGACASIYGTKITSPFELKSAILSNLPADLQDLDAFALALSSSLAAAFSVWLASGLVAGVQGMGPVPGFGPRTYLSPQPVIGGTVQSGPHLAAMPRLQPIMPPI